jgi:alpha-beta hydrolase superfamily lysophospholipase
MHWSEHPVAINGGCASLHGTLAIPAGDHPVSGALIISGSGAVDRDGNLPGARNNGLKRLAHGLVTRGVATLRIDKRGIGDSAQAGPDESDLRFSTYVDDACQWLDFFRARHRIGRCALIGHSEGALVATLAAQRSDVSRLILIAGLGRPAGRAILTQLQAAALPSTLLDSAQRTLSALEQGQMAADSAPELHALFRPSVQPYLISWLGLDPAKELSKIRVPTLVAYGTNDLQVDATEGQFLTASGPHVTSIVIPGMNHVLKLAPADRSANIATYDDPDLPIADELVGAVAAFLQ